MVGRSLLCAGDGEKAAIPEPIPYPCREYSWGDDLADDTTTTGSVEFFRYPSGNVRGQTVGIIESAGDEDWFAVELRKQAEPTTSVCGGRPTYDGTLTNPYLDGVHDANGNFIANASDDDGGEGLNSRVAFTPTADGTYYVAAGAYGDEVGTYELTIWERSAVVGPVAGNAAHHADRLIVVENGRWGG